jgi:two-component system sensor histidine kinase/response regulator
MSLENVHVMVVEDTMTQAMMIQHVLEKEKIQVTVARSGEKALKALADLEQGPDLVLCDVNMPGMSGYELCKKMKGDANLQKIPFVLLSTLVDSADLLPVIQCGADNFIYKTFEGEYFIQRLSSIWASRHLEKQEVGEKSSSAVILNGQQHQIEATNQRLANILVSAFETAVFHNRTHKTG